MIFKVFVVTFAALTAASAFAGPSSLSCSGETTYANLGKRNIGLNVIVDPATAKATGTLLIEPAPEGYTPLQDEIAYQATAPGAETAELVKELRAADASAVELAEFFGRTAVTVGSLVDLEQVESGEVYALRPSDPYYVLVVLKLKDGSTLSVGGADGMTPYICK